jgi:hypothetical protein
MAGRRAGRGQGGRGNNNNNTSSGRSGRGGCGALRGRTTKTGLTKELEGNIFDLGEGLLADLMQTTQIKIAQYIGSLYGGNIMGELETKKEFVAPSPEYPQSAKDKQADEAMIRATRKNVLDQLRHKESRLKKQLSILPDTDLEEIDKVEEKISEVENEILCTEYDMNAEVDLPLDEEEKGEWRQSQKAYGDRCTKHILNQQKAFAIIIGQCTQRLQDKLHDDLQWENINKDQKLLELYY